MATRSRRSTARRYSNGFLVALAGLALLYDVLSGVRWPGLWSMTFLLLDYSDGFIKRGLFGELLSHLLGERIAYANLAAVSFVVSGLCLVLLVRMVRRLGADDGWYWLVAAAVFVSPGFVFVVNTVGYLDHIGLLVALLCFSLPATAVGLALRVLLCLAMILVHEAFFLMFFPLVVLEFWLRAHADGRFGVFAGVAILVALTGVATYLAGQHSLTSGQLAAYAEHVRARAADFPVRPEALAVLSLDASANVAATARYWQTYNLRETALIASAELLPLSVFLVWLAISAAHCAPLPCGWRMVADFAIVAASASPLLLNLFAGDIWRFWSLTQITALLALLVVGPPLRGGLVPVGRAKLLGGGLAILGIIGAAIPIPLLGGYPRAEAPFLGHLGRLLGVLRGTEPWLQIPPPGV